MGGDQRGTGVTDLQEQGSWHTVRELHGHVGGAQPFGEVGLPLPARFGVRGEADHRFPGRALQCGLGAVQGRGFISAQVYGRQRRPQW